MYLHVSQLFSCKMFFWHLGQIAPCWLELHLNVLEKQFQTSTRHNSFHIIYFHFLKRTFNDFHENMWFWKVLPDSLPNFELPKWLSMTIAGLETEGWVCRLSCGLVACEQLIPCLKHAGSVLGRNRIAIDNLIWLQGAIMSHGSMLIVLTSNPLAQECKWRLRTTCSGHGKDLLAVYGLGHLVQLWHIQSDGAAVQTCWTNGWFLW